MQNASIWNREIVSIWYKFTYYKWNFQWFCMLQVCMCVYSVVVIVVVLVVIEVLVLKYYCISFFTLKECKQNRWTIIVFGMNVVEPYDPTMILLIGIWMSFTKKPIKPIIQKPMAVAIAIFWNSRRSGFVHRFTKRIESLANTRAGSQNLVTWSIFILFLLMISSNNLMIKKERKWREREKNTRHRISKAQQWTKISWKLYAKLSMWPHFQITFIKEFRKYQ